MNDYKMPTGPGPYRIGNAFKTRLREFLRDEVTAGEQLLREYERRLDAEPSGENEDELIRVASTLSTNRDLLERIEAGEFDRPAASPESDTIN